MKKESPCGGWTPCPSEPKLGNVTTGLQGDSLNRLENLTVLIRVWHVGFINSLILLWRLRHKDEKNYIDNFIAIIIMKNFLKCINKSSWNKENQDPFFSGLRQLYTIKYELK